TFTATPTNGGTAPVYQWMINGVNVAGQTTSTFTTSSLANGDAITVMMTSNDPCANPTSTASNPITISTSFVTPSVSITSSSTSVCKGRPVTFTTTATNGGTAPLYQWMINGVNVAGQTSSTLTTSTLSSGDMVTVMMTSNDPCAIPATASSNPVTVTFNVAPVVVISNPPAVCAPAIVDLTAPAITAGSDPGLNYTYWNNASATIPLGNPNAVTTQGTYYIQGSSAGGCITIMPVTVTIESKIPGIRYPDVTVLTNVPMPLQARNLGAGYSYLWTPSAGLDFLNVKDPVFTYDKKIEYLIFITSATGCVTVDTLLVNIDGPVLGSLPYVFVPKAWTPNGDGHNDKLFPFTLNISAIRYFRIYNRWGQKVFETNVIGQGWDGNFNGVPQGIDVYAWIIEAIGINGEKIKSAGEAVLLR
ncbi:MAG: gliding motility-associated C-terminal domain-containing protein, partial [Chitinophagaceae bacterium]